VTDTTAPKTKLATPRETLDAQGAAPGIDQPGGPRGRYRIRLRWPGMTKPYTEWHANLAVANARYWELPPAFVAALQHLPCPRAGLSLFGVRPRIVRAVFCSKP